MRTQIRICSLAGSMSLFALQAQTITATITGTVTDATGAVVPNAKVVATNTGTNLTYNATSNESGTIQPAVSSCWQLLQSRRRLRASSGQWLDRSRSKSTRLPVST